MSILNLIIFSGILSIIYGFWAGNSVIKSNPGSEKMQEISSAIQIGAQAYLNRQYTTIAIVGAVICVLLYLFFRDFLGCWRFFNWRNTIRCGWLYWNDNFC